MFETAEVGNAVDKATFKKLVPQIRSQLLEMQRKLAASKFSVLILISGVEGAGKPETINQLLEWIDARGVRTESFWNPSDEENERPYFWRFLRKLPPAGSMGIYFGSWYSLPVIRRVLKESSAAEFSESLDRIVELERMLAQENVLLVKLWLHMPKKKVKQHFEALSSKKSTRWRVSEQDWEYFKKYDRFRDVSEFALQRTSTAEAPWHVIEATDERYRYIAVAQTLLNAVNDRLAVPIPKWNKPALPKPTATNILRKLNLLQSIPDKEFESKLLKWQGRLNFLTRSLHQKKKSLLCVFEGVDAAGKGGAIRRLTHAIDARSFRVIPIAAPTDEEKARPYLWRFWNHLPRLGHVTIYDRSWYGRVLVERIEGFCAPHDWQRA